MFCNGVNFAKSLLFCKIKTAATRKYGLCPTIEACQCLMDIEQLG